MQNPPSPPQREHSLITFETATEARAIASDMVARGTRKARIFTRDLEPLLYNNREFETGLMHLLRSNPHSHCQVLIQDSGDLFSIDHRLLAVNQRLSSYMEVRQVPEEAADELRNFLLVDGGSYLLRPNSGSYHGVASLDDPSTVRDLDRSFRQWWEQSSPLSGSRRLHI